MATVFVRGKSIIQYRLCPQHFSHRNIVRVILSPILPVCYPHRDIIIADPYDSLDCVAASYDYDPWASTVSIHNMLGGLSPINVTWYGGSITVTADAGFPSITNFAPTRGSALWAHLRNDDEIRRWLECFGAG
jgi:hypothetical protein